MQEDNYYFNYKDINLYFKKGESISILGSNNDEIVSFLLSKNIHVITYKSLYEFNKKTVKQEISTYNNKNIDDLLSEYNLSNKNISELNICERIKLKILISILSEETIIIDNILSLLDDNDYKLILKKLNEYNKNEKIVINITNNIEETIFGNRLIIIYDDKLLCNDYTLIALREEKLLKRIGLGLPFIVELNKYLMDYGLINKYYLTTTGLVNELWK